MLSQVMNKYCLLGCLDIAFRATKLDEWFLVTKGLANYLYPFIVDVLGLFFP